MAFLNYFSIDLSIWELQGKYNIYILHCKIGKFAVYIPYSYIFIGMVEFSDEEGYGRFLDLHEFYNQYLNIKVYF